MIDFLTGLLVVCAAATAIACVIAKLKVESVKRRAKDRPQFYILNSPFSIHTAVFLFFATIATLSAQKTNAPLRSASVEFHNSTLYTFNSQLSMEDVSRGFFLESVITNDFHSYAMPTNGVRYDKWWKRGAYEDVFRLDLDGMTFPLGTNLCSSLWVYTWGMAGAIKLKVESVKWRVVSCSTAL